MIKETKSDGGGILPLSRTQYFILSTEMERSEEIFYAYWINPNVVRIGGNLREFCRIVKKVEKERKEQNK